MAKQRMRLFSFRPSEDRREFYVSEYYKLREHGSAEMTGKQYDITDDVQPYLVKAQRDMLHIVRDKLVELAEVTTIDTLVMEYLDEQIELRTDAP